MPWAPGHLSPLDPITGSHPTFFHLTIQHGTEPTTSTYLYRTYWALAESNNSMEDENGDHLRSAPTLMTSEKGGLRFLWEMKGKKTGRFQHGNSSQCVVFIDWIKKRTHYRDYTYHFVLCSVWCAHALFLLRVALVSDRYGENWRPTSVPWELF